MSSSELDTLVDLLHTELAKELLARIRSGEAPAAVLKEAREFLKDNGVQANPATNKGIKELTDALPFDEDGPWAPVSH